MPAHAAVVAQAADDATQEFAARKAAITDFDPKLILRVELGARVTEQDFARAGLTVLDSTARDAAVVFASDEELRGFRERLAQYQEGRRVRDDTGEEGSAAYETFFDAIDTLRVLRPDDRISRRLAERLASGEDLHFDVECWYLSDRDKLRTWLDEIRARLESAGGAWLDEYISVRAGVATARCRGPEVAVRAVAELDQVAVVDRVPKPRLTRADLAALQDVTKLDVVDPPQDAPVIGLIDSGIRAGHPLLEPASVEATALHDEFGGQGEDEAGHGTQVAGIALYGDVEAAAQGGVFESPFWIASVRVLDADACVPESVSFLRVITQAVEYLAETWEVKVINLSIGDSDSPFTGGKSTPLAAALDTLVRRFDLVVVVSAGNMTIADLQPHEEAAANYPAYLSADGAAVLDPAQAALALTVGSVSVSDGVAPRSLGAPVDIKCVAPAGGPAPFTRRGPGAQRALKPELAADGGNLTFDLSTRQLAPDTGSSVVTTSAKFPDRLFEADIGTSLSAAAISHVAGRVVREYPELSANAVRALVLQGADNRQAAATLAQHYPDGDQEARTLEVAGYGVPVWERVGFSQDNRVVMLAEDTLRPDDFHVFRVPMTSAFTRESGPHEVTVSLAFDPPVRHRRLDYLAYRMEFVLVRGLSLSDVYELAGAEVDTPEAGKLRQYEVAMRPTRTDRGRGANQVGRYLSRQRPQQKFEEDWHLVVRSVNRWMDPEEGPQRYAVAVALGVDRASDLYVELEAELRVELEVQL